MQYNISTDLAFKPLQPMALLQLGAEDRGPWWNQSLIRVNDCVARLGVFCGEFHWHKHEAEDELFVVLAGRLLLDYVDAMTLEHITCELAPGQALLVPRGCVHRTRAPERTVVLMIEGAGVTPTGD